MARSGPWGEVPSIQKLCRQSPPNCKYRKDDNAGVLPLKSTGYAFPRKLSVTSQDSLHSMTSSKWPKHGASKGPRNVPALVFPSRNQLQLGPPDVELTKLINSELTEEMLPRSRVSASDLSATTNWPCNPGKVRPSYSLFLCFIVYKMRLLS